MPKPNTRIEITSAAAMKLEPVVLEGKYVRLEPLSPAHRQGLCDAIADGELWNLFVTLVPHPRGL